MASNFSLISGVLFFSRNLKMFPGKLIAPDTMTSSNSVSWSPIKFSILSSSTVFSPIIWSNEVLFIINPLTCGEINKVNTNATIVDVSPNKVFTKPLIIPFIAQKRMMAMSIMSNVFIDSLQLSTDLNIF
ncbi:protein of unknown function [Petrocella atlantisensis]|uniref:Uncharacterized protein n=1 Tax=Petrocella atlantisensis TaxID=2173034 RepID=A0A3P7PCL9_9FIRM|nr:protein of unknown function [Petrocella atlantisensis]